MNFIELLTKRESTRKYSDQPVSREIIDICLEAARMAPSACNSQPWSFVVIDDEVIKNKIVDEAMAGIYATNKFVRTAPVIIAVITEHSKYIARMGQLFRHLKYNLIDIGIACDHLTLQAAELGIGTCWLGWFNEKAVKKLLGLPKKTKIDVLISMGYPGDGTLPTRAKNRKPLAEIRRYF
ncbi:MAG: nitroreductase family protein [Acidobacteria bacterium]|nr:nitroreductase family protein [Acidobacteriota bacterium]